MNAHEMCTGNEELQLIKILLEEACRQWCDFIEECPERLTGEGFGDFFLEIYFKKRMNMRKNFGKSVQKRTQIPQGWITTQNGPCVQKS